MKISKAEYTHVGNRTGNADSLRCEVLDNQRVYAVVADSLGSHSTGSAASQNMVSHLSECRRCAELPKAEQIARWIQSANAEISARRDDRTRMYSTAVLLCTVKDRAIWAHIGNSRLYHFYNGALCDYTHDYSEPQMETDERNTKRDDYTGSFGKNIDLHASENGELKPEIHGPVQLQQGKHAFLLCTDGFWEFLSENEIWLDLYKSRTPQEWITYLRCRGEMRKRGNADNNSAVAVFIEV